MFRLKVASSQFRSTKLTSQHMFLGKHTQNSKHSARLLGWNHSGFESIRIKLRNAVQRYLLFHEAGSSLNPHGLLTKFILCNMSGLHVLNGTDSCSEACMKWMHWFVCWRQRDCWYIFWLHPLCAFSVVHLGPYSSLLQPLTCLGEFLEAVCCMLVSSSLLSHYCLM